MIRYDFFVLLCSILQEELVVCNLGFPSQELFTIRDRPQNFYMLGSMGMVSSIALGLSLATTRTVVALDGDGSVLMNPGSLVTVAHRGPSNLKWIVVDNGSYGSTGDQPTYTRGLASLCGMAKAAGIEDAHELSAEDDFKTVLRDKIQRPGLSFIASKVDPGNRPPGPLPYDPLFIRNRFREAVKSGQQGYERK